MKKSFIRNRKVRYGGITVVLTILVITVAVLTNAVFGVLSNRFKWYTPMTAEGSYDVTENCFALLEKVFDEQDGADVEIIFCDLPNEENAMEDMTLNYVYRTAVEIAEHFPENIKLSCYDIWTNPVPVKKYKTMVNPLTGEDVQVSIKSTSVIITSGNYHRTYSLEEFFVFKDGMTDQVWAFDGEKKIAAGIMRAVSTEEQIVCLTNNHGETFYDFELLYLLDDAGYTIRYIDLHKEEIPENCNLIISFNPNSDLISDGVSQKSEVEVLEKFLSVPGNNFLVMLENGTPMLPAYEAFLEGWGADFSYYTDRENEANYRYMVQDSANSLTSDGYTIYGEAASEGHAAELLEGLQRPVIFKNATAIKAAQGFVNNGDGSYTKGNRTLYSLYQSSKSASCWANGKAVDGGNTMLMTLTEQKFENGSSYVGVIASADFAEETFLQSAVYGNNDAMMRTFRHMGKELTTEGLVIKPFASTDISIITTAQMLRWTLVLSITPALLITVIAVVILVKRRRA